MKIALSTPQTEFLNDIGDVFRVFFGTVELELADIAPIDLPFYRHTLKIVGDTWVDCWTHESHSVEAVTNITDAHPLLIKRVRKRAVKQTLYSLLKKETGMQPPWGGLTGIRPSRLYYEGLDMGLSPDGAVDRLVREFDVSRDRAELLKEIADMQNGLLHPADDEFDLYIGIPFCTTRCSYCSFSSGEIGDGRLVEPYTQALLHEIDACAALIRQRGLRLRAGYIGGGTPTAIPADNLDRILTAAQNAFPRAREWTVEAGRPDTIDREKLLMLKAHEITRISVNPQTFSDDTLRRIGRAHTGADTIRAYELARQLGFDDINMDLIAALPGETMEDFSRTLDTVISLSPESVTVHALAIKHSSRLHEEITLTNQGGRAPLMDVASIMTNEARRRLTEGDWHPYYLYRQKYVAGNQENVGYARRARACLYNIGNMEETASVLALGAGAITKWLYDRNERSAANGVDVEALRFANLTLRIERAPNVRSIEQYIARVDEMVARKAALILPKEAD